MRSSEYTESGRVLPQTKNTIKLLVISLMVFLLFLGIFFAVTFNLSFGVCRTIALVRVIGVADKNAMANGADFVIDVAAVFQIQIEEGEGIHPICEPVGAPLCGMELKMGALKSTGQILIHISQEQLSELFAVMLIDDG